jgi:hypothetical protein
MAAYAEGVVTCVPLRVKELLMRPFATIPVTITPEASAHVAEWGMQKELDQMLEYALETIPGLQRLEVWLAPPYDTGDENPIFIDAVRGMAFNTPSDRTSREWGRWKVRTFSPDVCRHFALLGAFENSHGG